MQDLKQDNNIEQAFNAVLTSRLGAGVVLEQEGPNNPAEVRTQDGYLYRGSYGQTPLDFIESATIGYKAHLTGTLKVLTDKYGSKNSN